MSILDNEGHDPNGLGNQPSRMDVELKLLRKIEAIMMERERLRDALKPFAEAGRHFGPYPSGMEGQAIEYSFTLGQLRAAVDAFEQRKEGSMSVENSLVHKLSAAHAEIARLRNVLTEIAEYCSGDDRTLGAIARLAAIRNTAMLAVRVAPEQEVKE